MKKIVITVLIIFLGTPVLAQERESWNPEQHMWLLNYVFITTPPEGFKMSFRSGDYPEIIEEYIPNGQNTKNWTQFFSVGYLGAAVNLQKLALTKEELYKTVCENYSPLFSEPGEKPLTFEFGFSCVGPKLGLTPKAEGATLPEVEITLTRYEIIDASLYQFQRTWQGTRAEYQRIQGNLNGFVAGWRTDLDRFSLCRVEDVKTPCPGLDREDASNQYNGEAVGVMTIAGSGASYEKSYIIDIDDIRTFFGMTALAKDLATRSKNGERITLYVRPRPGKIYGLITDRKKAVTFFTFLRNEMIDEGVAASKFDTALYNFTEGN